MDQVWSVLWNSGIPVGLLAFGIVVIWKQWREDVDRAYAQREEFVKALKDLNEQYKANESATAALTKSLSEFFLKHFP